MRTSDWEFILKRRAFELLGLMPSCVGAVLSVVSILR